ncbi:S-methyl-5'-thioinosine phosphorylase [Pseudomonadota bacterium]
MPSIGVIGGSGLSKYLGLDIISSEIVQTPYGEPSAPLVIGQLAGQEIAFLPRHGHGHTIPPHLVNYRANIWVLKNAGVENVISVAAVGSMRSELVSGELAIPTQIIDYTYSRNQTFFDGETDPVTHVDFTQPYCQKLIDVFDKAAKTIQIDLPIGCVYAATQGPRFESAAEVRKLINDGAHIVGMTGMPEVVLARELELCYATIAVIVNPAAGLSDGKIDLSEIEAMLIKGTEKARTLIENCIQLID